MSPILNFDRNNTRSGRFDAKVISYNHVKSVKDEGIGDLFMDVIRNEEITTLFQPIVSLKDGSVFGAEALSRGPRDTVLESPNNLFDIARIYGKLWELEFLCRLKALENMAKSGHDFNIFINVDPQVINDEKFRKGFTKEFLIKYNISPENVVFEITEKDTISDPGTFKKVIENYKDQGYKIAIDDTGSGYSGLKLITDIHPHFIKLDMNLIRDLDKDGVKYALIKTLYEFCVITDIKVIAEGIETENELGAVIDIGINYGQGFLIHKPSACIDKISPDITGFIVERNSKKKKLYHCKPSTVMVGDISRSNITIKPTCTGKKVLEIFNLNHNVSGLPVVENKKLAGLVMRDKYYAKLATQYGFALYLNRPASLLMDRRPLAVDCNTTLDVVSKLAMARNEENLYDYVIITKDDEYYGIVSIKDLLEKTTEIEINYAKHLNPLSGLPGNILIEKKLEELVGISSPYTVLYIDIDNFKVYNDVYGFENGDRMIQFLARSICESFQKECQTNYFIGHIGGDDFVAIVDGYDVNSVCCSIMRLFDRGKQDFYSAEHLENKSFAARNRHGAEERYGLATISIASVSNADRNFKSIYELSEYASSMKKKCKEIWESCCLIG